MEHTVSKRKKNKSANVDRNPAIPQAPTQPNEANQAPETATESKDEQQATEKPQKCLTGLWGLWQRVLGGEAKYSFGTAVFLTCLMVPILTCTSVTAILFSVAFGKIKLTTALTVLRLLLSWPMVSLNIFVACLGFAVHVMRKRNDRLAAREIAQIGIGLMLANKGNASAVHALNPQAIGTEATTATTGSAP